jgi:hypothetical protein
MRCTGSNLSAGWRYPGGTWYTAGGAFGASFTTATIAYGNDVYSGYEMYGRWANMKVFDAHLTPEQIEVELAQYVPKHPNCISWYPCLPGATERLKDYAGAVNLTEGGTLSDDAPPPIGWGTTRSGLLLPTEAAAGGTEYNITGDITVSVGITSTMAYASNRSVIGSVTVPVTVSASLAANFNESITGSITVPITIAATLGVGHSILGSIIVSISIAAATAVYQEALEGFRWRNDDQDEDQATWAQLQDVLHTVDADGTTRIRIIVRSPTGGQYQLECAKDGTENWFKVE